MFKSHKVLAASLLAASAALVACNDDKLDPNAESTVPVPTGDTVVLSSSGRVLTFNRSDLSKLVSSRSVKGLMAGEKFLGIDVRPQDGLIYGVTNQANIYTLNDSNGVVTFKVALKAGAATAATCAGGPPGTYTGLDGAEYGIDFNPPADRLRLASENRQDLRINVADGTTVVDCPIVISDGSASAPKPTGAAYTNSVTGAPGASTSLFYVDSNSNTLYAIDTSDGKNANNGEIRAVGPLGVDVGEISGFDIEGATGTAYGVFTVGTTTSLYSISTTTGAATALVSFAPGEELRGLTLK